MNRDLNPEESAFDSFVQDYDNDLAQGLFVSGEDKNYFCRGRITWLASCLSDLKHQPKAVLDFGCGTGSATSFFMEFLKPESLLGIDSSSKSLDFAREKYGSDLVRFLSSSEFRPAEQFDLVFCNGVFHHIPPKARLNAVQFIHRSLRPGGLFAFWENNPWNPGTRYVMSKIPFDRDAITLSYLEANRLLNSGGFEILRKDFLFIFPRILKSLRFIEPRVSKLPLGAQYQLLCRKVA